jgi:hypothetical protein
MPPPRARLSAAGDQSVGDPSAASACARHEPMSMSLYIVAAVVRCSRPFARSPGRPYSLPNSRWQWATSRVDHRPAHAALIKPAPSRRRAAVADILG